ncbi:hypothetical protein GCM10010124_40920 [Pilimelia terevasa]|uniref:Abnormal spindle-like microcephaly-associated protein ASH domain-containing protein n=1 Tax=Pilimelia terevasa TaxID=53372 RepID=A0A8J3FKW1_9ACTN|nr:hypothetical protein [Pilimelia terevasa]GGK43895.1 hypothetical protein GCM10010124_40920 [Pilimelia terevasa]
MASHERSWVVRLSPSALLVITFLEFAFLVALLLGYEFHWWGLHRLPPVAGGVVPLVVPWGGALGGVCIAFVGVTAHWGRWTSAERGTPSRQAVRWNGWYLVRVPLGAALGTVAALMVVLFLGTVAPNDDGAVDITPVGAATLMVVAFVVGYKQETFRKLLERTVEVIVGPGTPVPGGDGFTLEPATLEFDAASGVEQRRTVAVTNEGRLPFVVDAGKVQGPGDGFAVTQLPGKILGGDAGTIEVSFRPSQPGRYRGSLTVTVAGSTRTIALAGTCAG